LCSNGVSFLYTCALLFVAGAAHIGTMPFFVKRNTAMARMPPRILPTMLYLTLFCTLIAPSFAPARLALAAGPACTVGAGGGANYTTVQAAVDDVGCATINIAAGTYTENITIGRNITLQGAGAASTILDGHAAVLGSVVTVGAGATV